MIKTTIDARVKEAIDYDTFIKIISEIPSCIFFKDKQLRYQFTSHCWAQLNDNNVIGKTDLDIRVDKENALLAMESDREIIRTKKGSKYFIKCDVGGDVSYLELSKEPIMDENGEVLGIVGLINDVTEKTLADQKIQQLSEQRKLFYASMNHELRSPLNGIIGLLQLLMEDQSLNEIQRGRVSNAFQSSQMMLEIVNDLLDMEKMEHGEITITNEAFDFTPIIENIEYDFSSQARSKGLSFTMSVQDVLKGYISADATRIRQILHNLISNAVKYTEKGEVKITITYADQYMVIECSDTGQGIPPGAMEVLFDPFVRVNEAENAKIQGTGLGLSIVKLIIEKMSGDINVESEVGVGTTFTARIPVSIVEEADVSLAKKMPEELDLSDISILCVDDVKANLEIFAGLLASSGAMVHKVINGKSAILFSNKKKYDIIFMDHEMPGMDGVETFKMIREFCEPNRSTPVVALTGNTGEGAEDRYKELGFDGYLAKPVLKPQLIEIIQKMLAL